MEHSLFSPYVYHLLFFIDGYLKVDDILQHPHLVQTLKVTKEDIIRVVNNNDKQRFTLTTNKDGEDIIRANQGHSVEVRLFLIKY